MAGKQTCLAALLAVHEMKNGSTVDLQEMDAWLAANDPKAHSTRVAASAYNKAMREWSQKMLAEGKDQSFAVKAAQKLEGMGIPASSLMLTFADGNSLFGPEVINAFRESYLSFLKDRSFGSTFKQFGVANMSELIQKHPQIAKKLWKDTAGAEIKQMVDSFVNQYKLDGDLFRAQMMQEFGIPRIDGRHMFGSYAGKDMFGKFTTILSRNVVANTIKQVAIPMYNVFELAQRPFVIAAYHGDMNAAFRGFNRYLKALSDNNLNVWDKIPELDAQLVYGARGSEATGKGFGGKIDQGLEVVMNSTENPLRAIAYYTGEEVGIGGMQGLEQIGFVPDFANAPLAFTSADYSSALGFMRYSLSSSQMVMQIASKALEGNKDAISALMLFVGLTWLTNGTRGAVSAPLNAIFEKVGGQDYVDMADNFDKINPVRQGLVATFGPEFKPNEYFQGVKLGVPFVMAGQALASAGKSSVDAVDNLLEGNVLGATAEGIYAWLSVAMLGKMPGLNITTLRATKMFKEGVQDNDWQEAYADFLEKSRLQFPEKERQ